MQSGKREKNCTDLWVFFHKVAASSAGCRSAERKGSARCLHSLERGNMPSGPALFSRRLAKAAFNMPLRHHCGQIQRERGDGGNPMGSLGAKIWSNHSNSEKKKEEQNNDLKVLHIF